MGPLITYGGPTNPKSKTQNPKWVSQKSKIKKRVSQKSQNQPFSNPKKRLRKLHICEYTYTQWYH